MLAGYTEVRFTRPVYEGDSLALEMTVTGLKPLRGRPGKGLVTFAFRLGTPSEEGLEPVAAGTVEYVFEDGSR